MSSNDLSPSFFPIPQDNTDDAHEAVQPTGEVAEHITIGTKIVNAIAIVVPFIGLIGAITLLWGHAITWLELTMFFVMYLATAGGITIGFHRYYTHKSYSTNKFVQWVIGIGGSMAMQGTLFGWVATHRCHHQHSDRPGDPHSPHVDHDDHEIGGGVKGVIKGMWHSHMGWLFQKDMPNLIRYIPDLTSDPTARTISKYFVLWVTLGLILPGVVGGIYHQSWWGFLMGFLWGGLVRLCLVHHVTWSINSACHIWGKREFNSPDHSKNNVIFGILALGEGWHNNHHTFPASARHGLKWWQFDLTWITIKGLELVGLVWDVKVPPQARMDAKRVKA